MCIYIDVSIVYLYRCVYFSLPPSFLSLALSFSLALALALSLFLFVRSLIGQIRLPVIRLFLFSEKLNHTPLSIGVSITLSFALVLALTSQANCPHIDSKSYQ